MSGYYPADGRRSMPSRYDQGQAPPGANNYRPVPPSYNPPPPPPSSSSNHYDSYGSNRYNDRERERDRDRDRDRDRNRDRNRDRQGDRDDRYQSRRSDDYHPLPPRPQQSSYREFRGSDSFRPPQGDFTFRADKPSGVGDSYRPDDSNSFRGAPRGPSRDVNQHYQDRRPARNIRGRPGRNGPGGFRTPWRPFKPAERAILQGNSNQQPVEDFADEEHGVTYKAIDQLSDSDEADMDISDSDAEPGEPTAKRARTTKQAASGDSAPKWCNPDPYDALPPVDESEKKRKDMVQLIRKARVEGTAGGRASLPALPEDEDFIRCDSDSDEHDSRDASDEVFIDPLTYHRNGAPPGVQAKPAAPGVLPPPPQTSTLPPKPSFAGTTASGQVAPPAAPAISNGNKQRTSSVIDLSKSADLGTRKRTYDDVLKLPSHAKLKPASKQPVGGKMVKEWVPKPGQNSHPWVKNPPFKVRVNVRLHMEVKDFYEHVRPCQFEDRLRSKLVDDLNRRLSARPFDKDRSVYPFGSYMSGLYLPTGDMDLAYCSRVYFNGGPPKVMSRNQHRKFVANIQSINIAVDNKVEAILGAKVPLAKYVDKATGLKIDISFENLSGLIAIDTFKAWKKQWPVMPILVTIIKQYLLMRGLNEPVNGGIGGFSVICMVVSMLQMMPAVQSRSMAPEHNLGSLLMHFFDLYGNRFDHNTTALRLNPPGYINKNHVREFTYKNPNRLSIIDPNNPANDISGGSSNYPQIRACFSEAYRVLQERLLRIVDGEKYDSILDVILGGDYSTFREQREYLRNLHIKIFGDCDD